MGLNKISHLCKLYRGEKENPYNPNTPGEQWALEYLKFHIWDAEESVVTGFTGWCECWENNHPNNYFSEGDKAEEVYKYAIMSKLRKMYRSDIDFQSMYYSLSNK